MKFILTFLNQLNGEHLGVMYSRGQGLTFSQLKDRVPFVTNMSGIKMTKSGVYREHPDLMDMSWAKAKQEAIKRLYEKLDGYETEEQVRSYIIKELQPFGYVERKINPNHFKFKGG